MKLDIEELAKQAGMSLSRVANTEELEALTRLIVERCAVECEDYAMKSMFDGDPEADHEGAAQLLADSIRNLLEDK